MLDDRARGVMEDFMDHLPVTTFAFAYGSAVFSQRSSSGTKQDVASPMLDVILFVNDALEWHSENIELNRNHYGPIASLGASTVQSIASQLGTGLHFNPFVRFGSQSLKYGVISTADARKDLHSWQHMYLAGRMHKPIDTLSDTAVCKCIQQAILSNRIAAVTAAVLLQQDKQFTALQLLRTIVGLSYTGDVRMTVAEDSNKVENIVTGSMDLLQEIYSRDILSHEHLPFLSLAHADTAATLTNDPVYHMPSLDTQRHWVASLPSAALLEASTRQRIPLPTNSTGSSVYSSSEACTLCSPRHLVSQQDLSVDVRKDLADRLCYTGSPSLWLPGALAALVARSSRRQALAGLLATSPGKSLAYVGAKLHKRFRSLC